MTSREQLKAFSNELDKLVDRFGEEYDLSYAQIIGTMQYKVHLLCEQAGEESEEEEEEENEH